MSSAPLSRLFIVMTATFYDCDIGFFLLRVARFRLKPKHFVWNCLGDGSTYFVTPPFFSFISSFYTHVCSNISLPDLAVE